jgi:hypothetical protein
MKPIARSIGLASLACLVGVTTASADVRRLGAVTVFTAPARTGNVGAGIDFANAREMPLPANRRAPQSQAEALRLGPIPSAATPGFVPGRPGTGEQHPVQLAPARDSDDEADSVRPSEFGTSDHPFSTSRVNALFGKTVNKYPFTAAGKLFFKIGSGTFVCSASSIKPGIVVTAAHCVADFGQNQYYSSWTFVPAYNKGTGPYGSWTTQKAYVLTSYLNGTDSCTAAGVVCQDDVAILVENPQNGQFSGDSSGIYGYGFDGFGFNDNGQVLVNQLGYPVALDQGERMQRNDSQGFVDPTQSNNTIIGSLMTGGSSGGPWLVNLGMAPKLQGTSFGTASTHNVVVGVTSWGYTLTRVKQQGASPFTSANIVQLVNTACSEVPAACQ